MDKFDKLKLVLSEVQERSFEIDFVLCETFLTNDKARVVEISGYNLLHKIRISMKGGGVGLSTPYVMILLCFKKVNLSHFLLRSI